ncbi:MAG: hypothetical protein KDH20_07155 [Rhodocyclaceae bacterium]|nr:hypothetical protein [Rhodocyclaceae bacterium]
MTMQMADMTRACGELVSLAEACERIAGGGAWMVAADERQLRELPRGQWIGGTIPYFMAADGGVTSREGVFLKPIELPGGAPSICSYDARDIHQVCSDAPENGYTLLILPAFSDVHSEFARNAPNFEDMFGKPLVGWISGVHLDDLGLHRPATMDGSRCVLDPLHAVAMHVPLPADMYASVDIVNGMVQGSGDRIRFRETGFEAGDCLINDVPANLADYLDACEADLKLPLVADYCGAAINVSLKGIDRAGRKVSFYAPVFEGIEYRFAEAPGTLPAMAADEGKDASFSCNCILNYVYGELEGRRTGRFTGPMTFGEIAYLLLNQTLVHLSLHRI